MLGWPALSYLWLGAGRCLSGRLGDASHVPLFTPSRPMDLLESLLLLEKTLLAARDNP